MTAVAQPGESNVQTDQQKIDAGAVAGTISS